MKRVREIREIKHDIKVKEVKGDNKEEIEELTSGEVPLNESEMSNISHSKPIVLGGESAVGRQGAGFSSARPQTQGDLRPSEASGTRLYDVGRGMGNESEGRSAYKTVEDIQGPTMRAANVGRDFAMGGRTGVLPEDRAAQNLQGGFNEQSVQDRKYDSKSMEEKARGKRGHGYAWEN